MSWHLKGTDRTYYYRSRRRNGQSRKIYVGPGSVGEDAEREDLHARLKRQDDRYYWFCVISRFDEAKSKNDQLLDWVKLYQRAVLVSCGLYLHHGHEWRQRKAFRDE